MTSESLYIVAAIGVERWVHRSGEWNNSAKVTFQIMKMPEANEVEPRHIVVRDNGRSTREIIKAAKMIFLEQPGNIDLRRVQEPDSFLPPE